MEKRKVMFSGVKPTGEPTLGNYLGAIKNWVKLQDDYDGIFSIVDLHALTVRQDPAELRRRTLEIAAIYLAAGIDPTRNIVFIQSHVPSHSEASWLLTCQSYMGELSRMTQFKDKTSKTEGASIPVGLFMYPVLMAVDILLYQTDVVPVGVDQVQHVELTRDLAVRFNNQYSDTFVIPEVVVNKSAAKIQDLQDPSKKMSKSDTANPNGYILIMDKPEDIRRKVSRAVTDSIGIVNYTDEQPGVKNLINIITNITGESPEDVVKRFEGKGYKEFKEYTAEVIISELAPLQEKVKKYLSEKTELENILRDGAEKAKYISNKTLRKIQKKVGLVHFK